MTAAELLSPATARHRVACGACGWTGYRRNPSARGCPACGAPAATVQPAWLAGCAPHRGCCCYLVEIRPALKHASHYLGSTIDLPRRWAEHQAGNGSRLLATALGAGCQVELVRVWYGQQARGLEQRLKQRRKPPSTRCGAARSLRPLCPLCNPAGWSRHYPDLPDPPRPAPRWHRFRPDPARWDADGEWDRAFPELAYSGAGGAR
jgi:predicted GIY-YIG superfamily endonuclease